MSLISTNKLDILAVCESFLDSTILDSEVVPFQYTVYRSDRNRHGGGLLLAITNSIIFVHRPDLKRPDIGLLWTQLFCDSCSILFGVTYRPPSSVDFVSSLATFLHMISPSSSIYLCTDFNFTAIDWFVAAPISSDKPSAQSCDLLHDAYLSQSVLNPTRGCHVLDLVLTNNPSCVSHVNVCDNLPGTDHDTVSFTLSILPPKQCQTHRHLYH